MTIPKGHSIKKDNHILANLAVDGIAEEFKKKVSASWYF